MDIHNYLIAHKITISHYPPKFYRCFDISFIPYGYSYIKLRFQFSILSQNGSDMMIIINI